VKNDTELAFHCAQISINLALSYNTQSKGLTTGTENKASARKKVKFVYSLLSTVCKNMYLVAKGYTFYSEFCDVFNE
jgi:hypothetical protein